MHVYSIYQWQQAIKIACVKIIRRVGFREWFFKSVQNFSSSYSLSENVKKEVYTPTDLRVILSDLNLGLSHKAKCVQQKCSEEIA
jgi:hypothetical protein